MRSDSVIFALSVTLALAVLAPAEDVPPIRALDGVTPRETVFDTAGRDKPLVLKSKDDAAKHFDEDALARLTEAVDFAEQVVLVFAWKGSGQDRLEYAVLESFPEQVVFSYTPGRTKDLRPHVRIFALRSNVKWRTKGSGDSDTDSAEAKGDSIKVEVRGKLNSQVVAIGGETTGFTITANKVTWELDFGKHEDLRKLAEKLHEQQVVVSGTLHVKEGVEIHERWIVDVAALKAAGE